ncbi:bicaudal-D-related protein 2-like [Myxocyprinus asiaticus]|uniref:bicaudal-D-related protein 2-like n=1 Tax=Myxocyprinus asiaticus TaxID=70543 RepID=UPI002221CC04|nr:bicaudal-D-related protein 2-like [Myxocyprinus asiaticus]
METHRRDAPVTLHTLRDLLPLPTEKIHKRLSDDDDSGSSHNKDTDRETFSSQLPTLNELQEQLAVVGDNRHSSVTGQNGYSDQMTVAEDSNPDSLPRKPKYIDEALPDLLRSGSPIRRRVSSPVSATLKQVKREVELSRQRSLKLKAQVDRLQRQSESGPGWSQNRERVTEEVQSIVKLLLPLTDIETAELDQPSEANPLDIALLQLQNVARRLALNHTSQGSQKAGEDAAILQQALRDRDEAIAKKQAMESELLKSKNELMTLNNHLLEAVQKRLELTIELEAWKDDVQTILHHQLLKQQQEEQAQKSRGFGVLRRSNKPLPPKPDYSTLTHVPVSISHCPSPYTLGTQSPSPSTPGTQRWKDKFRRGRTGTQGPVTESQPQKINREDNFYTVSLD